ncbi:MAG TPA: ABC transporter permease [Terriglobales bacterium]|jgi:phospholipid/cholesterol/gamma-HCH transport system permease protein|nr:ABC transporter permease [Terriglobales bacterium]
MATGDFLSHIELVSPLDFAKAKIRSLQEYSLLAGQSLANLFRTPRYVADIMQQADLIGVGSLPIVLLTGFFTGAVLAVNTAASLGRFGALSLIGQLVSISMVRELGPVLTGLMVAGRNASGMASELGSMIVTEQIDAMRALGTDPIKKLVTPRVVSTIVMLFFLVILSDFLGLFGGSVVSTAMLGLDWHQYWSSAWQTLVYQDLITGLSKPVIFGFLIATVGCYYGMSAKGGTQGVGKATTEAVVASSILIISVDFFVTRLLMLLIGYR